MTLINISNPNSVNIYVSTQTTYDDLYIFTETYDNIEHIYELRLIALLHEV